MTPRATINVEYELGQAIHAYLNMHGRPDSHRLAKFVLDTVEAMRAEMHAAAALAAGKSAESAEAEVAVEAADRAAEADLANG